MEADSGEASRRDTVTKHDSDEDGIRSNDKAR